MSQDRPTDEFPFAGLSPPGPPAEARGRVLALAREALAEPVAPDVWTRIWGSRPLRLAWAACVLILIVGHLLISVRAPRRGAVPALPAAGSSGELGRELAAVATLPPIDLAAEPLTGGAVQERGSGATPDKAKEKKS
jgi:hypothetical protein